MFSWFATNNGRLFTRTVVGIASASVFGANVIFHGPLLEKYQSIVSLYENGKPAVLNEGTIALAQEVMEDMKLKEKEKQRISFFSVLGHEVFHAGGKNSPWGGIIGLPFHFQKDKKFNLNNLKLAGVEDFDWSIDGLDLMDAMRLSKEAVKFAIAREILLTDIKIIIENASLATLFMVLIPARLSDLVNKRFDTFKMPIRTRLIFYGINYFVGIMLYYCFKHPTEHLRAKKCDEVVAKISDEYLKGGIEFYQKTLSKNKEFRELMGLKGEKLFTHEGNENYFLFVPRLPFTKRLENLQELEKKIKEGSK